MTNELKFEILFEKALKEWPRLISLEIENQELSEIRPTDEGYDLYIYKNIPWDGNKEKYVIKDIYDMEEEICSKHHNTSEEILWVNLHSAIYSTIIELAYFVNKINTKYIRIEVTKNIFESRLKYHLCTEKDKSSWSESGINLVKEYFNVNSISCL
jgi:hypothetical protein